MQLERIGHHQEWEDKYYELFYALGIKKIHVNDPAASKSRLFDNFESVARQHIFLIFSMMSCMSLVLFASKYMRQSEKYCLERVLVGATPALDNLNHTMSRKTGE